MPSSPSGFLTNDHLPHVSRLLANDKGDNEVNAIMTFTIQDIYDIAMTKLNKSKYNNVILTPETVDPLELGRLCLGELQLGDPGLGLGLGIRSDTWLPRCILSTPGLFGRNLCGGPGAGRGGGEEPQISPPPPSSLGSTDS